MTDETNVYSNRAAALRDAFDRSFASSRSSITDDMESVITFSIAGDRFAVRLLEISGMAKSGKIVPVPSNTHALLGLAGIRGELLPVYWLPELLDYCNGDSEVHWLLICGGSARIAFGINDFLGCFKVLKSAFKPTEGSPTRAFAREVVVVASEACTVIDISSLLKSIRNPKKERT